MAHSSVDFSGCRFGEKQKPSTIAQSVLLFEACWILSFYFYLSACFSRKANMEGNFFSELFFIILCQNAFCFAFFLEVPFGFIFTQLMVANNKIYIKQLRNEAGWALDGMKTKL
jgi:hypothetical protein